MLKSLRLQTKFFILYSIILTVVLSSAFVSFYLYLSRSMEQHAIENLTRLSSGVSMQIDSILAEMDKTAIYIVANPTIGEVFSHIRTAPRPMNYFESMMADHNKLISALTAISIPNSFSGIRTSLYNSSGDYISLGTPDSSLTIKQRVTSPHYRSWYQSIFADGSKKRILPPHDDFWTDDGLKMVSVLRQIQDYEAFKVYGIVEVQQPYRNLENILSQDQSGDIRTYMITECGALIYPLQQRDSRRAASFYLKKIAAQDDGNMKITNPITRQREIVAFHKSPFSGWTLLKVETQDYLLAPVRVVGGIFLLTGLGILILTLTVVFLTTNQLTKPLKQLTNSIQAVNLDNLALEVVHPGNSNEILQLTEAFDAMFQRLKESMNELLQIRAQEMKAHLIALQSQMDPHFLYNMLAIISAAGREGGAPKVVEICRSLSNILRYITAYQEDSVPIQSEIDHAANYLKLMKLRFEGQFDYEIRGGARLAELNVTIPKLTLQPLLENCFQHGFAKIQPPWRLKVDVGGAEGKWFIAVSDNGIGFPETASKDLLKQADEFILDPSTNIKSLKLGGMGLINTIVRLKLLYKENMIFAIQPNPEGGSTITIGGSV